MAWVSAESKGEVCILRMSFTSVYVVRMFGVHLGLSFVHWVKFYACRSSSFTFCAHQRPSCATSCRRHSGPRAFQPVVHILCPSFHCRARIVLILANGGTFQGNSVQLLKIPPCVFPETSQVHSRAQMKGTLCSDSAEYSPS